MQLKIQEDCTEDWAKILLLIVVQMPDKQRILRKIQAREELVKNTGYLNSRMISKQ